jgi:heme/copper-type cytochrome/quinol oxidase subunit 2
MDTTSVIISVTTIVLALIVLGVVYAVMYCLNKEVDKTNR